MLARLVGAPVVRCLDSAVVLELAGRSRFREHRHGDVLLPETPGRSEASAEGSGCAVLVPVEGWCLAVRSQADGSRTVVAVARPGGLAALERLIPAAPPTVHPAWVASGDGAAVRIPAGAFLGAIRPCPAACDELQSALAERAARAEALLADRTLPPTERLRRLLLRLGCGSGASGPGRARAGPALVPLTQSELAALIGTSRETVNRSLQRLAAAGVVVVRGGRATPLRSRRAANGEDVGIPDC